MTPALRFVVEFHLSPENKRRKRRKRWLASTLLDARNKLIGAIGSHNGFDFDAPPPKPKES